LPDLPCKHTALHAKPPSSFQAFIVTKHWPLRWHNCQTVCKRYRLRDKGVKNGCPYNWTAISPYFFRLQLKQQ